MTLKTNYMKKITVVFLLLLLSILPSFAQNSRLDSIFRSMPAGKRPKIAVVMSGGGAKGIAHIGVLKYLEELGIPVDIVTGTSMGAVIGGLYSLGYTSSEMDALVQTRDWNYIISDKYSRETLSYEEKKENEQYLLSVPFMRSQSIQNDIENEKQTSTVKAILGNIPSSMVQGQNIFDLLTALSVGYHDSIDFNTLPIPFACVAVDMNSRKEVVFHSGSVARAVRASMAIPGYFSPAYNNGMCLVDGGMLNNFPVDVAREMGADIVIGVDLHYQSSNAKPGKVDNILDEVNGMMKIMQLEKYKRNEKDVDIIITPEVSKYGILDFSLPTIAALNDSGYVAATRSKAQLEDLLANLNGRPDFDKKYSNAARSLYAPHAGNLEEDSVSIAGISFNGINESDANWLMRKAKLAENKRYSGKDVEAAIDVIYRTGAYKSLRYYLKGTQEPYNLLIDIEPGKLHQFNFGFKFDTEETAAMLLNVSLNKLKLYGPKLDITGRLSYHPYINLVGSYTTKNLTQFNIGLNYRKSNMNIYDCGSPDPISNMIEYYGRAEFSIQSHDYKKFRLIGGFRLEHDRFKHLLQESYSWIPNCYSLYEGKHYDFAYPFAILSFDNIDKSYFPTKGGTFSTEYDFIPNLLMKGKFDVAPFQMLQLDWEEVIPMGSRFAAIFHLYGSAIMPFSLKIATDSLSPANTVPFSYMNILGGYQNGRYTDMQLPFIGTTRLFPEKRILVVPRLDLRFTVKDKQYITLIGNYAQSSDYYSTFFRDRGHYGVALGYSIETLLGPVELFFHYSDLQRFGAYLNIGYYF
jgi:NTE family protein